MRFLLFSHLENARNSLRSHRSRSLLTMVGITIGVASITTILALSVGATGIIQKQVDELGGNIAIIRPGTQQLTNTNQYSSSTLTENDMLSIAMVEHVIAAAPLMLLTGAVVGDEQATPGTPIVATTPALADINQLVVRDGQFLDTSINRDTAVIGAQLSIDLFGSEQTIGKTVQIRGSPFTIVGILERQNEPINYSGVDFDAAVIINEESGKAINNGVTQIQQINVQTDSVANLDRAIIDMNQALLRNHFGEADFTILSGEAIAQPTNDLFSIFATIGVAIAGISLVVGGIGVMNIMLVTVAERTREIGIRKAVGASNSDIVWQFIIESLFLSIGGGIAGYVGGYILAFGISTFLPFDPAFTWEIAGIAAATSLTVGVLFGLYPAVRAAKKDPIDALRQYD
jgi:putative ABC transport system permease protein